MTKNKNRIWFVSGYGIALILLLYFGLNGLIVSAMGDTFPNVKFMTVLALFMIAAWSIGLGGRHYLNRFTRDSSDKFKNSLLAINVMSWIMVLIPFSII